MKTFMKKDCIFYSVLFIVVIGFTEMRTYISDTAKQETLSETSIVQ